MTGWKLGMDAPTGCTTDEYEGSIPSLVTKQIKYINYESLENLQDLQA